MTDMFISSWDFVENSFEENSQNSHHATAFIHRLRKRGFDTKCRAGRSMNTLMISNSLYDLTDNDSYLACYFYSTGIKFETNLLENNIFFFEGFHIHPVVLEILRIICNRNSPQNIFSNSWDEKNVTPLEQLWDTNEDAQIFKNFIFESKKGSKSEIESVSNKLLYVIKSYPTPIQQEIVNTICFLFFDGALFPNGIPKK